MPHQAGVPPDTAVVALHVSAIGRTARDPDALSQMNDVVARELADAGRPQAGREPQGAEKLIKR